MVQGCRRSAWRERPLDPADRRKWVTRRYAAEVSLAHRFKLIGRRGAVQVYARLAAASGWDGRRVASLAATDSALILNLHSVAPNDPSAIDPAALDRLLAWLRPRCQMVTFGQLGHVDPSDGPVVILSFDDGYRDFIEYAAPILDRHGVAANQNVVPGCVEANRPPWNVELLDAMARVPASRLARLSVPHVTVSTEIAEVDAHRFAEIVTGQLKRLPKAQLADALPELHRVLPEIEVAPTRPMMSVADVREIARDHEIGLHSFNHDSMEPESDEFFSDDTRRCVDWYRAALGDAPTVYAFPNGSFREPQPRLAMKQGFRHVLLVGERCCSRRGPIFERVTMFGRDDRELRARLARAC